MAEEKATVIEETIETIEEEEKMAKVIKLPFGVRLGKVEKQPAKDEAEKLAEAKPKKMPTWKKVGIGIGTAAAAIGLVGAGIALGGLGDVSDEEIATGDVDPSDDIIDVEPITE